MTLSNRERADRCQQAITAYSDDDSFTNLVDFLADAMHWCHLHGQRFPHRPDAFRGRNAGDYIHELNDQQQDERRMIP